MRNYGVPLEFIQELKSRVDIVSIISRSTQLTKKGRYYWACCPFHFEKTPSFAVSQDEQYYHCYGCGESGDVISFYAKYENLSFMEAVKMLAQEANMQMPALTDNTQEVQHLRDKEKALRALNLATEYYKKMFFGPSGEIAREYAKSRLFDKDIIDTFAIGYSPDYNGLVLFLDQNGIDRQTMINAGLCGIDEERKSIFDNFGSRLIFPIRNAFGDTVGFTARTLKTDPSFAKYKNSPQTIVFDKSRTIYNIDTIKNLRKTQKLDYIYVCEGTIDVIAMYRAGVKNCVACMGTAITSFHAKELKRYTDKIMLCLDGDSAGQHATFRAIDIFAEAGLEVRIVKLKENLDPDEYLKKYGKEELISALSQTYDAIEYKILSIQDKYDMSNSFHKNKFVQECLEVLSKLPSESEKEIYLKTVAKLSSVPIDILRRDIYNMSTAVQSQPQAEDKVEIPYRVEGNQKAVQFVLASIVHKKDYAEGAIGSNLTFKNSNYQNLYDFVKKCILEGKTYTISALYDYFDTDENKDIGEIIGYNFDIIENQATYFKECLSKIMSVSLLERQEILKKQFNEERDPARRKEILVELGRISKELKNG